VAGEWRDSALHVSTRPSVWGREEGGSSF